METKDNGACGHSSGRDDGMAVGLESGSRVT